MNNIKDGFCSALFTVPVCGTTRQHAQHWDPETDTAKWDSAIIHFIIYTFPAVSNILCEKGLWD